MKGTLAMKLGIAIAGVLLAGTAFAQDAGGGPGGGFGDHRPPFERAMGGDHGRWWNNPKTVDRLKLTDAQRKAMDDTLQEHKETLVDLRGSLEKANARFLLAIRSKLTPEQWKQMEADRASRPHGEWGHGAPGANGQGRPNWQRHGQTPPPADG